MATESAKAKKRRILRPAPTVRQKQEQQTRKITSAQDRGVWRLTLWYIGTPFRLIGRGILGLFRWLNKFKVFRIIGYIFVPPYFRSSWRELRQVTWPTFRETWKLTFAVILFSVIFGVLIMGVDFGLDKLFRNILLK